MTQIIALLLLKEKQYVEIWNIKKKVPTWLNSIKFVYNDMLTIVQLSLLLKSSTRLTNPHL